MKERDDSHTGRTVALIGGSALVLWLLLRGKGFGLGARAGGGLGGGSGSSAGNAGGASTPARACQVFIRANHIDLDGAPADLSTVISRCRAAGKADVRATGDAIVRAIGEAV